MSILALLCLLNQKPGGGVLQVNISAPRDMEGALFFPVELKCSIYTTGTADGRMNFCIVNPHVATTLPQVFPQMRDTSWRHLKA